LNRLQKDPPAGIAAVPSDDNILIWHAFILGLVKTIDSKKRNFLFFKTK
jgi:ubiquitin-protein ligase